MNHLNEIKKPHPSGLENREADFDRKKNGPPAPGTPEGGEFWETLETSVAERLDGLGLDGDRSSLIFCLPLLMVGWADGSLTRRERLVLEEFACSHDLIPGENARTLLQDWIEKRPEDGFLQEALSVLTDLADSLPMDARAELREQLSSACVKLAEASSGFYGLGSRTSSEEREALKLVTASIGWSSGILNQKSF